MRPDHVDGLIHNDFEKTLAIGFVSAIDEIVKEVVEITKYTDVIDIIKLIKVPVPYEIRARYKHYENENVPKQMFYDSYKYFNFNVLEHFNDLELERISKRRGI